MQQEKLNRVKEAIYQLSPMPGDTLFADSPDAGPDCLCSRCGEPIAEPQIPLRAFVDEGRGGEYRYHFECAGLVPAEPTGLIPPEPEMEKF